jgi:hypothetical protein
MLMNPDRRRNPIIRINALSLQSSLSNSISTPIRRISSASKNFDLPVEAMTGVSSVSQGEVICDLSVLVTVGSLVYSQKLYPS